MRTEAITCDYCNATLNHVSVLRVVEDPDPVLELPLLPTTRDYCGTACLVLHYYERTWPSVRLEIDSRIDKFKRPAHGERA